MGDSLKNAPKWIAWETTRQCNLSCVHCRSNACPSKFKDLDFTTEMGFKVIDDIASFSKPVLVLSGGEPLLRDDIFELAKHGTKAGLRMALATNGTLVTQEVCKSILSSGIKIVSLSLDGASADVHDAFRQEKGAFDATLNAAQLFNQYGIPFIVNSSFTKRNAKDIKNVYELSKKIGATAWYLFMVVPTGRGEDLLNELLADDKYQEVLEWHYEMESQETEMMVRPTCAPHYYRIRFEMNKAEGNKIKSRPLSFSTGGNKGCIAGQSIMTIDVEGNVQPCSYLPLSAGNVFTENLSDIWESSEIFKNLRNFKSYQGRCGSCEYIKVCGGCRARAHYMNGSYLAEEPLCHYQPVKKRLKEAF